MRQSRSASSPSSAVGSRPPTTSSSRIFDFEWLEGDRTVALREPYSIVLTEDVARRIFGDRAALGETLLLREIQSQ